MFFLPVFYYAVAPFRSSLNMEERDILDDTLFTQEEAAPLARAYKRVVAASPELDKSSRLDLMRHIVDLAEEGMRDEETLVRFASKAGCIAR